MQTKMNMMALSALAVGMVVTGAAFAQQSPRSCIHFQTGCSDAPYASNTTPTRPNTRPLYNSAARNPKIGPESGTTGGTGTSK